MNVGLRIDADTLRGTQAGVPNLCSLLAERGILGSFFFSVGPDNMGRNLWRLLRPAFFIKMLRSRAGNLYGWSILLRGTFWPGPEIGERAASVIRAASESGHDIGLHAWDHHAWQSRIERMGREQIRRDLKRAYDELVRITGKPPACSAVPGWRCNDPVLLEKSEFPFRYNSDCRGESIFLPVVNGAELVQPQIPVTLPTYDETIGRNGVTDGNYNDCLLLLMKPDRLNVLTIHAEVEGDSRRGLFVEFLRKAGERGISLVPLPALLAEAAALPRCGIEKRVIPGRDGWVAVQKPQAFDGKKQ